MLDIGDIQHLKYQPASPVPTTAIRNLQYFLKDNKEYK